MENVDNPQKQLDSPHILDRGTIKIEGSDDYNSEIHDEEIKIENISSEVEIIGILKEEHQDEYYNSGYTSIALCPSKRKIIEDNENFCCEKRRKLYQLAMVSYVMYGRIRGIWESRNIDRTFMIFKEYIKLTSRRKKWLY